MLSRLVRPSVSAISQLGSISSASQLQSNNVVFARCLTSATKPNQASSGFQEGPERDLVNFPRPKRLIHPPPVRLGFIPDNWFTFFYNKTGVTGGYTFGVGLLTYVLSKEIWVLEHEFWGGVSLFIMVIYATKKFGPGIAAYLDKETDAYAEQLNAGKKAELQFLNDSIEGEKLSQFQAEGAKQLFDVKRENVALQLEDAYRQRMMTVFTEVKKRLDYQVDIQQAERNIQQQHMVNWIIDGVKKAITPESEAENLKKCIADLRGLATK